MVGISNESVKSSDMLFGNSPAAKVDYIEFLHYPVYRYRRIVKEIDAGYSHQNPLIIAFRSGPK